MELTEAQCERIAPHLPVQRGNVRAPNPQALNAIPHVAEHGWKRRGLPSRFGNWRTIHMRMNRWPGNGALDRVFEQLQRERVARTKPEAAPMDGAVARARPDGTGALKERPPTGRALARRLGRQDSRGCRGCPSRHRVLALAGTGPRPPEGRKPLNRLGKRDDGPSPVMDRAREGSGIRQLALALGHAPVAPPLRARTEPWERNRETRRRRNETGRLFRRLRGFRRIFTRFGKPGVVFLGFILFALIVDAVR